MSANPVQSDIVEDEVPSDLLPEELEVDFRPTSRPGVLSERFGDETLVVDSEDGQIHILNPTAGVVWGCLDGSVSIEELAGELSQAYRAPLEQVRRDTLQMVRDLGSLRLLVGVSPPLPEMAPLPGLLEVGDELSRFAAVDASGTTVSLPHEGAVTLLVNWSPFCGYCAKVVPELATCTSGLAENRVELVLLTVGPPEANSALLEGTDLAGALHYRPEEAAEEKLEAAGFAGAEGADPFGPMGTPVAYLLDAKGRVERPIAYGAIEVPLLARSAARLAEEGDDVESVTDQSLAGGASTDARKRRQSLPAASGMCAPSASSTGKPARVWAPTGAYNVGDYRVGIRADSKRSEEIVARAFSALRSDGGDSVQDNFSVVLGDDSGRGVALSLLLAGDTTVVRSRSPRRVLSALASRLSSLVNEEVDPALLRATNLAALVEGRIVLLPPRALYFLERLQPRLARLGARLSDEPLALLDAGACELVVPGSSISPVPEVLAELCDLRPTKSELPPLEPGRYPINAWAFDAGGEERSPFLSRAGAVAAALPSVQGEPEDLPGALTALGQLFGRVRAVPLRSGAPDDHISAIEEVIRGARSLPTPTTTDPR